MDKLSRSDLMSLERYADERDAFRARAIAHKRLRSIALGANMTLLFEDRVTVQYQVQEMLRIERLFEAAPIQEELDSYNPLIPDGENLKATLLIEFPDPDLRAQRLAELRGIEHALYLQVGEGARVKAIADEDMDRSNDSKTSAVHFLRFQFNAALVGTLREGAPLILAVDDDRYRERVVIEGDARTALLSDFD